VAEVVEMNWCDDTKLRGELQFTKLGQQYETHILMSTILSSVAGGKSVKPGQEYELTRTRILGNDNECGELNNLHFRNIHGRHIQ
jgi:hypothetical protein